MVISTTDMLAEVIRDRRIRRSLNQEQVGQLVGIKQTTISALENHPERSRVETLFKILSALGLELHIADKTAAPDSQPDQGATPW